MKSACSTGVTNADTTKSATLFGAALVLATLDDTAWPYALDLDR